MRFKTIRIPSGCWIFVAVFPMLILMNSCATSYHVRAWSSNADFDRNLNKVLVMGLINNVSRRFDVEREIVDAARKTNMSGTKGMALFPPEMGKPFDNIQRVRERLQERGFDAVLTVAIIDVSAERYIGPERQYIPQVYYNRFGNYYYHTYAVVYTEGYYTLDSQYFLETNLYELKGGTLIWSGRSFTFDPLDFDRFLPRYSKHLFKELRQDGVIAD
jgi:hypothetical protein